MANKSDAEYYSVALIGSSGGGTATLGHTDPNELITTIHRELIQIRNNTEVENKEGRRCRVCLGLSHAIFVSLCDGSGFDSISEKDWIPDERERSAGPNAALYAVGFDGNNRVINQNDSHPFNMNIRLVDRGPLTKINKLAQRLDILLGEAIRNCHKSSDRSSYTISAIISLSSESTTIHSSSLRVCSQLDNIDFPIVGSGGTSLSRIASLYDLRIVGNSGGSVASTTLTKARGWAMGLAKEWGMTYDATSNSIESNESSTVDPKNEGDSNSNPVPTLKSILEAALPSFLFVCIALRLISSWEGSSGEGACAWDGQTGNDILTSMSAIKYVLRHIVLGTTCCVLAASSYSNNASGDSSTLLMSASVAGVLASASASQSAFPSNENYSGGSALAGLIAGAFVPSVLTKVSNICFQYHVTATMTNILCGGGVGMLVGMLMHSGVAQGLSLVTGAIRSLLRGRLLLISQDESSLKLSVSTLSRLIPLGVEKGLLSVIQNLQEKWPDIISQMPSLPIEWTMFWHQDSRCAVQNLPIPLGLGFLYGCIFVYGSKVGWYHSLFLPAILLEMDSAPEGEEASLFGAIDQCTLVMVCAGICAANLITKNGGGGHASLSFQALKTNLLCGDFIEAAYPSMERSRIINGSAYIAAGLSTEIILNRRVLSSAYLPLPLAIWISNDRWGMGAACLVAFVVSCFGTLASNILSSNKNV